MVVMSRDLPEFNLTSASSDKLDFFQNPINANTATTGVIYTSLDKTVHSVKLMIANSTHQSFTIFGKRVLEDTQAEPPFVKSVRTKQGSKCLIMNPTTEEMEIFSNDLSRRETRMEASWGDEILGIQQLPQSLMINTKREINFLRLG